MENNKENDLLSNVPRVRLVRKPFSDAILSGSNYSLYIDDKHIPFATEVNVRVRAGELPTATVTLIGNITIEDEIKE